MSGNVCAMRAGVRGTGLNQFVALLESISFTSIPKPYPRRLPGQHNEAAVTPARIRVDIANEQLNQEMANKNNIFFPRLDQNGFCKVPPQS